MNKIIFIFIINITVIANCVTAWPEYDLYTRANKDKPSVFVNGQDLLKSSLFSASRKTYFIIHGYFGNGNLGYLTSIKDALLAEEDANVFAVDWSEAPFSFLYTIAARNARECGRRIVVFMNASGINPMSVHCIGHSLGAHICGFTGKIQKLNRITGLDPAGPLFKGTPADARLDKTDANYVDNIHGDSILGIQLAIGHKDFYPNGGQIQCPSTLTYACSHIRPILYFTESIKTSCAFKSFKCSTYIHFKLKLYNSALYAQMGFNSLKSAIDGRFYLDTNTNNPFCKF